VFPNPFFFFVYSAIQVMKLQIFMTSSDKLEAFDTIDSWCFVFILIVILYDFFLFIRSLSVLNELCIVERFYTLIKFFVIDSMITLITGTVLCSDIKVFCDISNTTVE
jgi:hypothetical protein